eukprot:7267002-Prymnesium_polylepis.1
MPTAANYCRWVGAPSQRTTPRALPGLSDPSLSDSFVSAGLPSPRDRLLGWLADASCDARAHVLYPRNV